MTGLMANETPVDYTKNGEKLDKLPKEFYSSRSYSNYLIESISENQGDGKPFLAYLSFSAPHDPLHVLEPWLSKYRGKYDAGYQELHKERFIAAKKAGIVHEGAAIPAMNPVVKPWNSLSKEKQAEESRKMEVYAGKETIKQS